MSAALAVGLEMAHRTFTERGGDDRARLHFTERELAILIAVSVAPSLGLCAELVRVANAEGSDDAWLLYFAKKAKALLPWGGAS